jgi:hypothetical protein
MEWICESDRSVSSARVTGYLHPVYAESLIEFGTPFNLERCGGWILVRRIPRHSTHDAMGCYPLFACQDWHSLHFDLSELTERLVSLVLVTDPFGEYDLPYLNTCFEDMVRPFKNHFVVDLTLPAHDYVSPHHRRYAHKALREIRVEDCENPADFLDSWLGLYRTLIGRHRISGIGAFSKASFAKQLAVPGMVALRAVYDGEAVGMLLWYVQGPVAYYHLGAYSPRGYELRASFALFWFATEYFAARGLKWLNLGAGAGIKDDGRDGLSRFKKGWSTGTRPAYLCGRVFDRPAYKKLTTETNLTGTRYFPVYRAGEFR